MLALRYTLGEQKTLDKELPLCVARGAGISPVCSRPLRDRAVLGAKYNDAKATPEQLERARKIDAVCKRHGAPGRGGVALHHPTVASVIPGGFRPEHITANVDHTRREIPPR